MNKKCKLNNYDNLTKADLLIFYMLKDIYLKKTYGFFYLSSLHKKYFFNVFHINTFYLAIKKLKNLKYIKIIKDKYLTDKKIYKCVILKGKPITSNKKDIAQLQEIKGFKRELYRGRIISFIPEENKIVIRSDFNKDLYFIALPNKRHPFFYIPSGSEISVEGICIDSNFYCSQIIDINNPEVWSKI